MNLLLRTCFLQLLFIVVSFKALSATSNPYIEVFDYSNVQQSGENEELADTAVAHKYYQTARAFTDSAALSFQTHCDSTVAYYLKAAVLYKQAAAWKQYVNCYELAGGCMKLVQRYGVARGYFEHALETGREKLGAAHVYMAGVYASVGNFYYETSAFDAAMECYRSELNIRLKMTDALNLDVAYNYANIGLTYFNKGVYDSVSQYYQRALHITREFLDSKHPFVAKIYENKGLLCDVKGLYNCALENYRKALDIRIVAFGPEHSEVAGVYSNMGVAYLKKGSYDVALKHFQKSLDIKLKVLGHTHPYVAKTYQNMAIIYLKKGGNDKALEYNQKALDIHLATFGKHHHYVAGCYHNMGVSYKNKGAYTDAHEYLKKALNIQIKLLGPKHRNVAGNYLSIALVHEAEGAYDRSLEAYRKCLNILHESFGEVHPDIADAYHNIGGIYARTGLYDRTLEYYQKALRIRLKLFDYKHPRIGKTYYAIANVYRRQGHFDESLVYCQKSLIALIDNFEETTITENPTLEKVNDKRELLEALKIKATVLEERYMKKSHDPNDLRIAVATHRLIMQLIDRIKDHHKAEKSKFFFAESVQPSYEEAIRATLHLYEQSEEDSLLALAFRFAEKSKAGVLWEALRESKAKSFAGIPDSLLSREEELKTELKYHEAVIEKYKSGKTIDSLRLRTHENRFFELNRHYEKLITDFERKFPRYYALKHNHHTPGVAAIQKQLHKHSALIEYMMGDSILYTFVITKEQVMIYQIPLDTTFHRETEELIAMLTNTALVHTQGYSEQYYQNFVKCSRALYMKLLAPALENTRELNELVIVPDGLLSYLPFEVLLSKEVDEQAERVDYATLPYLLKDYRMRYAYSGKFLLEKQQRKKGGAYYAGFAPMYHHRKLFAQNQYDVSLSGMETTYHRYRQGLVPLHYNQSEVYEAQQLLGGQAFLAQSATEKLYREEAGSFRVLHFAGHALTNDSLPMQSALVFSPSDDTSAYDLLHAWELYSLSLPVELAVLSACETGLGKQVRGEGVMSLSRAFRYAGCPNIAMSLWKVDDEATGVMMRNFFKRLKAGEAKDEALRKAKLNILNNYHQTHPYYWAAFVLIGDEHPVQSDARPSRFWLFAGGIFIVVEVLFTLLLNRRRRKSALRYSISRQTRAN